MGKGGEEVGAAARTFTSWSGVWQHMWAAAPGVLCFANQAETEAFSKYVIDSRYCSCYCHHRCGDALEVLAKAFPKSSFMGYDTSHHALRYVVCVALERSGALGASWRGWKHLSLCRFSTLNNILGNPKGGNVTNRHAVTMDPGDKACKALRGLSGSLRSHPTARVIKVVCCYFQLPPG